MGTVHSRSAWKYVLTFVMPDPRLNASVPSEFRHCLVNNGAGQRLLDELLILLKAQRLLNSRRHQWADSTYPLPAGDRRRDLAAIPAGAGIERPIFHATRGSVLDCSWYFGEAETHVQPIGVVVVLEFVRVINWPNDMPEAVYPSPLATLAAYHAHSPAVWLLAV